MEDTEQLEAAQAAAAQEAAATEAPAPRTRRADPFAGKKDDESIWVENMRPSDSNFVSRRTGDPYPMTGHGVVGSVISVPVKVAKEAYFRRAVTRGIFRIMTDEEAYEREGELVFADDDDTQYDRTMEALEKGASESGSRYKNKHLSEDGNEGRSVTAKQVWGDRSQKPPSQVRRSEITAPAIPLDEIPDGPMDAIIEAPVKEGDPDWRPDTGR